MTGTENIVQHHTVTLKSGKKVKVPMMEKCETVRDEEPDWKKNYFHSVLESGVMWIIMQRFMKVAQ